MADQGPAWKAWPRGVRGRVQTARSWMRWCATQGRARAQRSAERTGLQRQPTSCLLYALACHAAVVCRFLLLCPSSREVQACVAMFWGPPDTTAED